jgi:pyrroline-5-carboxylate reductase
VTKPKRSTSTPTSANAYELVVLGGGQMGEALIGGLLQAGWCKVSEILVVEPATRRGLELTKVFPGITVAASLPATFVARGALIAVKPHFVVDVCEALAGSVPRVLSIAAGVTSASIEKALGVDGDRRVAVIRAMPNTPAMVGYGASAIAKGSSTSEEDLTWATEILSAVGVVEQVDERLLDAVTGLSGSGPAYIFLVAEAMIEGGVLMGLPRNVATTLAAQTIAGAGLMLSDGAHPATLRGSVTSPGGTTAAGLRVLEQRATRSAFIDAVAAATERARELG